ncbi:MAG: GAF domain-containing protein [Dehalococcoidia bacterium]|nr:GAF domain-containing protein [Dehalococcoidia bacterium]
MARNDHLSGDEQQRVSDLLVTRPSGDMPSTSGREVAAAIDLLPVAALIYDRDDGTIRHANPLFESLSGASNDELAGHQILDFYRDAVEHDEFISELLRKGIVTGRHVTGALGDGSKVWVDTSSRWVVYGGKPAVLTLFTDIDAEKRAQLASELERVQISGLAEISRIVAHARLDSEAFERVVEVVNRLVPFDRVGLVLIDPEEETFTLKFVRGTEVDSRQEGYRLPIGRSLNAIAAETRESVLIDDIETARFPDDFPGLKANRDAGIRSLVTAPLIADDRVIGTLSLRSKSACAYDAESVALIERITALLAPALEQSRLYDNLEREARERQIIAEMGRVINSSPDLNDVYSRFTDLVRQILPADRLAVTTLDREGEGVVILYRSGISVTDRAQGHRMLSQGSMTTVMMDTRKPVLFHPGNRADVEREYPNLLSA